MSATTFDTLAAARDLEAAGVERSQAEAIAKAIRNGQGDLSTKADIAGLEARIDNRLADLKADMLKVAIGVAIGIVIANATLTAVFVFGALRLLQP